MRKYNADPNVNGILVQLPLPPHINEETVLDAISIEKDVDGAAGPAWQRKPQGRRVSPALPRGAVCGGTGDAAPTRRAGFHPTNIGRLAMRGRTDPLFVPCTPKARLPPAWAPSARRRAGCQPRAAPAHPPSRRGAPPRPCRPQGCIELLKRSDVPLKGARAVVVGRSNVVGMPAALLLQRADATVTVVHSRTVGTKSIVQQADIVVAAVGIPEFVKGDWIKPGAAVIDVGINPVPDSTKKTGYRLVRAPRRADGRRGSERASNQRERESVAQQEEERK